jgi:fructose-1,6-bisphosphatase/inositol monophosphatase family enzyme
VSLVDRVSRLLAEVAAQEVMTRFRALAAGDIERKPSADDPDDLVTAADREVERRLTGALIELLPGSRVVGEEATHAEPALMGALAGGDPVWVIDPIDGTRNFALGDDAFGIMLALVDRGATRAAWIALPARGRTFVAEQGAGCYVDGVRLRVPAPAHPLRGSVYTRFMPAQLAASVTRACEGRFVPQPAPGAAAMEYTSVMGGEKEFVVYYRLYPWDHAPGALLLAEAGGCVEHLDGSRYRPIDSRQVTVVAASPAVAAEVRSWLSAVRA